MSDTGDVLVLGIGNVLQQDDGVGVHVARALVASVERDGGGMPPDVRIVDGGTLGLALLPLFDGARAAVVIDAMELGRRPGAVVVMGDREVVTAPGSLTTAHDLGLVDLLEAGRLAGLLPASVTVIGVQPRAVATGLELSPPVAASVPEAADAVRRVVGTVPPVGATMPACISMPSPSSRTSATRFGRTRRWTH